MQLLTYFISITYNMQQFYDVISNRVCGLNQVPVLSVFQETTPGSWKPSDPHTSPSLLITSSRNPKRLGKKKQQTKPKKDKTRLPMSHFQRRKCSYNCALVRSSQAIPSLFDPQLKILWSDSHFKANLTSGQSSPTFRCCSSATKHMAQWMAACGLQCPLLGLPVAATQRLAEPVNTCWPHVRPTPLDH